MALHDALAHSINTIAVKVSLDVGRKQIRAIELIVRALILESYGDQERLLAGLRAIERRLTWLPLGAQYVVAARKP